MKIAVADIVPASGAVARNLAVIEGLAAATAAGDAGLLVLPRRSLTGAAPPEDVAELSDGPSAHGLRQIAARHQVGIIAGYVELCTGRHYDSALLIDAAGRCLANYRCSHLGVAERQVLSPGQWLTVVPIGGFRCGVLIGPDLAYPEPTRALALAGIELLAVLGDAPATVAAVPELLVRARAAENAITVAYAGGGAGIAAPDGRQTGQNMADGLVMSEVVSAMSGRGPDFAPFAGRRQRLYQRIVATEEGETGPPI